MSDAEATQLTAREPAGATIINFRQFLEDVPPGGARRVSGVWAPHSGLHQLDAPSVVLHCGNDMCDGSMIFDCLRGGSVTLGAQENLFLVYRCRHCELNTKVIALHVRPEANGEAVLFKLGEMPPFGPPFPPRVLKVVGEHGHLLLKGRRSENQGLGVGAFGYYRRVVENAKKEIIGEVLKVAVAVGAPEEVVSDLRVALEQREFSRAVERIKHGIPDRLMFAGHNPLLLLHGALSEGLHELTDERCLELAQDIRVVLTRLLLDAAEAVREDAELARAVGRLAKRKQGE